MLYAIASDMFRGSIIDSEYKGISIVELFDYLSPDVLDGGFSLDIILSNDKTVSCSGYNTTPKNFRIFSECINEIVSAKDLTETIFSTNSYSIEVPSSWLNEVKVHYSDDCNTFYLTVEDTRIYLFNMYGKTMVITMTINT